MDLKSLKLELLERISLLEDEARLLALKRLLDAPRGYGIPNEHLSVVKEGEAPYFKLEDRSYSAEEVRKIVDDILRSKANEDALGNLLLPDEWEQLEREGEQAENGEGSFFTLDEVMARLRRDLGK